MSRSRLIELLAKRDLKEITLLEQKELSDLMKQNHQFAQLADAFQLIGKDTFSVRSMDDESKSEQRWALLKKKLESVQMEQQFKSHRRLFPRKWVAMAAAVIGTFLIGAYLLRDQQPAVTDNSSNIVATKRGSKSYLVLPDGTKVWLNSATEISYDRSFGEHTREVTLSGEAYFDVVKDPDKPFVVHTAELDLTVLGTAFNVNAYEQNSSTETTLIHGAVEVVLKRHPGKKIFLKPLEKISVQNNADSVGALISGKEVAEPVQIYVLSKVKQQEDSGSVETQWVHNKLVFDNQTLEEIARQLALWYDIEVKIMTPSLRSERYSAVFNDATLDQVLHSLQLTGKFNYSVKNKTVTIAP